MNLGDNRNGETEGRTRSVVGGCPQLSLVTLDDRTADGKPYPQAIRFGRVERSKQLLDAAWIQADTRVSHQQFDIMVALNFRLDSERSWPIIDAGHRISCIQQQVQDDLLKLYAITSRVASLRLTDSMLSRMRMGN